MAIQKQKSKVYFTSLHAESQDDNRINKILKLYKAADLGNVIAVKDLTAIKVHFGEFGNDTFIAPWYYKKIVDLIKEKGADAFEFNEDAYYGRVKGLWTHTNTRKDKTDMFPQTELLDMLLSL